MALKIYDTLEPQGNYPVAKAKHIQMPNGMPLSEWDPSWDELTDRPFGTEQAFEPIVWDGVTEGRTTLDISFMGSNYDLAYKMTDYVIPAKYHNGMFCVSNDVTMPYKLMDGLCIEGCVTTSMCCLGALHPLLTDSFAGVVSVHQPFESGGLAVAETGTFFFTSTEVTCDAGFVCAKNEVIIPLDEKYLPMDAIRQSVAPPIMEGAATIEPGKYYRFGEVSSLDLTLAEKDDGLAHEYLFEFIPSEDFAGLTITPEPRWIGEPQYPAGKRCIVSVQLGLAVMGCG